MAAKFQSFMRWLPATALVLAVVLPVQAQRTMRRSQAILFSSPNDSDETTNAPSLAARTPELPGFANAVQAPTFNFNPSPQTAPLPAPSAPIITQPATDQMRQLLDQRENWTLLTPEEILGVSTPETILGLTERDAIGRPRYSTAAERFLKRQESLYGANTNGFLNFSPRGRPDFSGDWLPEINPGFFKPANEMKNPNSAGSFFTGASSSPPISAQNAGQSTASAWPRLFTMPSAPPPTLEQRASMETFRKLLQAPSPPDSVAKIQPLNLQADFGLPSPQPTPTKLSKPTESDLIGASFVPLSSGIGKPIGIAPLTPGLVPQKNLPLITSEPEWKPQLPPWMLSTPQPGVIPQRKF